MAVKRKRRKRAYASKAAQPYDYYDQGYNGLSTETRIVCEEFKIQLSDKRPHNYIKLFMYTYNLRPLDATFNVPLSSDDIEAAFLSFITKRGVDISTYRKLTLCQVLGMNGIRKVRSVVNKLERRFYLVNPLHTLTPLLEEIYAQKA